jgi:beta-glucosidase
MHLAYRTMPTLDYDLLTEDGRPGWIASWFAHESDESLVPLKEPLKTQYVDETRIFIR